MLIILTGFIISIILVSIVFYSFFCSYSRYSSLKLLLLDGLSSAVSSQVGKVVFLSLFTFFIIVNVSGNIPLQAIPTQYYSFTLTVSLLFWIPIIVSVSYTDFKNFFAHLLPYGSPVGLMLILPLIEGFSQIIRPFTLIIRLRTNLAAGHIMIFMFSYFTLLSDLLIVPLYVVLYLLFFLELAISALQAYIFVSLLSLYVAETV